jgi:hypothetical protein
MRQAGDRVEDTQRVVTALAGAARIADECQPWECRAIRDKVLISMYECPTHAPKCRQPRSSAAR